MSEEKATETAVTKPVGSATAVSATADDAKVVHDQQRTIELRSMADEEKAHDDLVADVTKLLEQPDGDTSEKPGVSPKGDESEKPPKGETAGDGEDEKGGAGEVSLSRDLQTRAEKAGISKDLAEQLHQAGQLEDVVAMSDRRMIEYVREHSPSSETKGSAKGAEAKEKPKEEAEADVPSLDPDVYDEDLVKRDAYQQRRIDALEAQVQQLSQGSQGGFDEWFDDTVDALDRDDLFGKGTSVSRSHQSNRDAMFEAYKAISAVYGEDPNDRSSEMAQFAFAAEFQDEFKKQVKKEVQQQQLNRTRDAQGKFLTSSRSKGGPPPKDATPEEVHSQLVSNVDAYLKEQGVQMSGY